MSSQTTFTSTTSMAGGKNNCRNYIKKLNVNALNLMGNGIGHNGNGNYYYSSNSANPNRLSTMTMSSLDTPLKKRNLHSSSPSKYSSPYHTNASSSICKDFNLIFANASNSLSPEWDMAFKRLKVMHCNADSNMDPNREANSDEVAQIGQAANMSMRSYVVSNSGQPEHELNELTQDFHRLKTPFT